MDSSLRLKFWGTRGLVSSPGKDTAVYGGNTSCIQILYKEHLIIIDTGFGVTNLGEELMKRILEKQEKLTVHIFYTHFHWDHIQGLPFFHPIYFPTSTLRLYSPVDPNEAIKSLDILFDGSYSPFAGISSMPSQLHFHQMKQAMEIDNLKIDYILLDHGWNAAPTFAYKLSVQNEGSIVIALDHEARESKINDKLIDFSKDCTLLIHDAQFSEEEYEDKKSWGHSSGKQALENALKCGAKELLLAHHNPDYSDSKLNRMLKLYKSDKKYSKLKFSYAKEELIYNLLKK